MGKAKRRGTFEERLKAAVQREAEKKASSVTFQPKPLKPSLALLLAAMAMGGPKHG